MKKILLVEDVEFNLDLLVQLLEEKFELRHSVTLTPGGRFARLLGVEQVMVNSLHGQAVMDAGARIEIEGRAEDGTAEALAIRDAPGFALAVQWHAEWQARDDAVSRPIFAAFGDAARAWRANRIGRAGRTA